MGMFNAYDPQLTAAQLADDDEWLVWDSSAGDVRNVAHSELINVMKDVLSGYTITNAPTASRSINWSTATLDEKLDLLATILRDLGATIAILIVSLLIFSAPAEAKRVGALLSSDYVDLSKEETAATTTGTKTLSITDSGIVQTNAGAADNITIQLPICGASTLGALWPVRVESTTEGATIAVRPDASQEFANVTDATEGQAWVLPVAVSGSDPPEGWARCDYNGSSYVLRWFCSGTGDLEE